MKLVMNDRDAWCNHRPLAICMLGCALSTFCGCQPPVGTASTPAASLETQLDAPAASDAAVETEEDATAPTDSNPSTEEASTSDASPTAGTLAAADSNDKPAKTFSSSRAPARPGEAEKISFDDLVIGLQADVVFRPWMMGDRPKELDGKNVRISGHMHGAIENPEKTKEFVLLRNLECKFGPGGQADHLAQVYMKPGTTTKYPGKDVIKVEGTLKIEPFVGSDGNTWSLYRIEDAEVVR